MIIFCTAPDTETARTLAKVLVDKKLAACVSFQGGWESRYRWKGKVETAKEVLLLIKAPEKSFKKIKKAILQNHPYEVPEILAVRVGKSYKKYLQWLESSME